MNTAIWRIRRALQQTGDQSIKLVGNAREVRLDLPDPQMVDAHHFRRTTLDALKAHGQIADFAALEQAASLHDAPFLEEYDDDWVLEVRESLKSLKLRLLCDSLSWHARERHVEDALHCAQTILACDPTREAIHRVVMLLFAINGERAEAVRQFKRCESVLRRECDISPMPETHSLLALIKSDTHADRLPQFLEAELARGSLRPFVIGSSAVSSWGRVCP